jgi:hypothetical protein
MIQPVPKSKKERKSISRQVNLAISSPPATTEYLKWSDQPVRFSRADHPRKVPRPTWQYFSLFLYACSDQTSMLGLVRGMCALVGVIW